MEEREAWRAYVIAILQGQIAYQGINSSLAANWGTVVGNIVQMVDQLVIAERSKFGEFTESDRVAARRKSK